jgi:hypothetical protein
MVKTVRPLRRLDRGTTRYLRGGGNPRRLAAAASGGG